MINFNENHQVEQWGRQLPNGQITWHTADTWVPQWSTPEGRVKEQEEFDKSLVTLGVDPSSVSPLIFVHRVKTVTYSEMLTIIDDE